MPLFNEVVIGFECVDLSQGIMFIWSKQHQLHWMWLWDVSFWMCARCYLLVCYCSKFKIVRHGRMIRGNSFKRFETKVYYFCWFISNLSFDQCPLFSRSKSGGQRGDAKLCINLQKGVTHISNMHECATWLLWMEPKTSLRTHCDNESIWEWHCSQGRTKSVRVGG
jgi:hypothetical protein